MFKPTVHLENQLIMPGDFFLPFGGKLDEENRWVRLARLVPWAEAEKKYGQFFKDTLRGLQTISLRPKKRSPATESEQQTFFIEKKQAESEKPVLPNQGTVLMDATCAGGCSVSHRSESA